MDEKADNRDTVLNVINNLYVNYIKEQSKNYLVLEGDAPTFDIIQSIKTEYGSDLNWLIPYPGDWHLLKNYQHCLMKPFFESGLKDMASACGYPVHSVKSCYIFHRTHQFLMETWESIFRHMLKQFLEYRHTYSDAHMIKKCDQNVMLTLKNTLADLKKEDYDNTAISSVLRSMEDELDGLQMM